MIDAFNLADVDNDDDADGGCGCGVDTGCGDVTVAVVTNTLFEVAATNSPVFWSRSRARFRFGFVPLTGVLAVVGVFTALGGA